MSSALIQVLVRLRQTSRAPRKTPPPCAPSPESRLLDILPGSFILLSVGYAPPGESPDSGVSSNEESEDSTPPVSHRGDGQAKYGSLLQH